VTEVRDLTQAFGTAPSVTAEPKLSSGIEAIAYWTFAPSLEVVLADADRLPAEGQAVAAWTKRLNKRAIPLVLIVEAGDEHLLVGPSGKPPPAPRLDARLVVDELAAARRLDPLDVRKRLPLVWQRVRGAGGMTGLRNVGLFSTHYLRSRTPRLAEWPQLTEQGGAARGARSLDARLKALGFESEERGAGLFLLRTKNRPAAAVLSYPPNHDFDRAGAGGRTARRPSPPRDGGRRYALGNPCQRRRLAALLCRASRPGDELRRPRPREAWRPRVLRSALL
jgi:hypothetical protein